MLEGIANLGGLDEYVEGSGLPFRDAILEYYAKLGERLGFTVRRNSLVVQHGINLGRIDLMWVEPGVVFICEFGELENVLKQLWKALELSTSEIVLILSSKAKCSTKKVSELIKMSRIINKTNLRIVVIDVNDKKALRFDTDRKD